MALFGKKNSPAAEAATPQPMPAPAAPASVVVPVSVLPKPPADFYTLLLGLSVAALFIAAVVLSVNISFYGPNPLSGIPRG